jgi:hypothetical protein
MPNKNEALDEIFKAGCDLSIVKMIESELAKFTSTIESLESQLNNRLIDNMSINDHLCDWISDHIDFQKDALENIIQYNQSITRR